MTPARDSVALLPTGAGRALARITDLRLADLEVDQLGGSVGNQAGAVLRVRAKHRNEPWSVILKVLRPSAEGSLFPVIGMIPKGWGRTPTHSHYWRREGLVYDSDLPDLLQGPHARMPAPLLIEDHGEEMWIWLEDIPDEIVGPWPADRLVRAARQIAGLHANSTRLAIAANDALRPHVLRAWVEELHATNIAAAADERTWEHPYIKLVLPGDNRDRMRRLIERRTALLDALQALPQVVTQLDAHRRNIITTSGPNGETSVVIDWAYAGTGAIGEDLGSIVAMTCMLGEVEPCDMRALSQNAFAAYIDGLRAQGWNGEETHIRLAGHAACALQAGMINSNLSGFAGIDPTADPALDELVRSHTDILADMNDHFLWHADQAWRILHDDGVVRV